MKFVEDIVTFNCPQNLEKRIWVICHTITGIFS